MPCFGIENGITKNWLNHSHIHKPHWASSLFSEAVFSVELNVESLERVSLNFHWSGGETVGGRYVYGLLGLVRPSIKIPAICLLISSLRSVSNFVLKR